MADPSVSPPKLADRQELVAPRPAQPLAMPAYPAEALEANALPAIIVVRIVINPEDRLRSSRTVP